MAGNLDVLPGTKIVHASGKAVEGNGRRGGVVAYAVYL